MLITNTSSALRYPPFQSLSTNRVQRCVHRGRCGAQKQDSTPALGVGMAQILLSAPAWAEDLVNEAASKIQTTEVPSVPSAEEVLEKAPAAGGSILDLFTDNPILLAGLGFLAAVPLIIGFFSGGALGVKSVNPSGAVEGLSSDPNTLLIDIRSREEIKEQGSPNLSATKKKAILLPFTREVQGATEQVEDFVEKFGALKQIKEGSSIIIIDASGSEAPQAAKQLAKLVGRVYYVQGGAEGWKESGEAWREAGRGFSLPNLDTLADDFKSQPTLTKAGIAVGAAGVAAAVLFQEVGVVLELGVAAAAGSLLLPQFLQRGSSGGGTVKRQVKDFVEDSEKAAGRAADEVGSKAEELADSDLGAKAEQTAEEAGSKLEDASDNVQAAAKDAAQNPKKAAKQVGSKAEEAAGSAKDWIEDWKKEQK